VQPILTINARENCFLEVMRDYFELSNPTVRSEIQYMHFATQQILAAKGVKYAALRSGLVPSADRHEAGFIFDSTKIESPCYGFEVARAILPLLDKRATQSVLCGDLLGDDQNLIRRILEESLVLARSFEFIHGTSLYCVYINNLSEAMLKRLHAELQKFTAYLGFIPATFASRAKTYLSTTLVNSFLKNGACVIMGHEDDHPNDDNVNVIGYPFEEFGYRVLSLQSIYFGVFLSYKIERAVYKGFQVDTEMALNAVSDDVLSLKDFTVLLEEAKHAYLVSEKAGKLKKTGIAALRPEGIASLIKSQIAASYIYNLSYLEQHNVIKFNTMLEVGRKHGEYPTKLMASLEYKPQEQLLRVITLY